MEESAAQTNSRHRVQVDFGGEAYDRLKRLKEESEAKSYADVVRNSVRLYEWFLQQQQQGYRLALVNDEDDLVREVELMF